MTKISDVYIFGCIPIVFTASDQGIVSVHDHIYTVNFQKTEKGKVAEISFKSDIDSLISTILEDVQKASWQRSLLKVSMKVSSFCGTQTLTIWKWLCTGNFIHISTVMEWVAFIIAHK